MLILPVGMVLHHVLCCSKFAIVDTRLNAESLCYWPGSISRLLCVFTWMHRGRTSTEHSSRDVSLARSRSRRKLHTCRYERRARNCEKGREVFSLLLCVLRVLRWILVSSGYTVVPLLSAENWGIDYLFFSRDVNALYRFSCSTTGENVTHAKVCQDVRLMKSYVPVELPGMSNTRL